MDTLFCLDDRYKQHFGVAVTSLLLNNPGCITTVHVIIDRVDQPFKDKISQLEQAYQVKICLYEINAEAFHDLKISAHVSHAVYFRLLVSEVLPQNIDKLLYLDSDLVVNGSLRELWNVDVSQQVIAACGGKVITTKQRLQLAGDYYFNSGVMLINLELWRSQQIGLKSIELLRKHPEGFKFWDQDALNKIIDGNFVNLDKKWNSQVDLTTGNSQINSDSIIIHFVGSLKPWYSWCFQPERQFYWRYLKKSPWANAHPALPGNSKQILSALRYLWKYLISPKPVRSQVTN